MSQNRQSLKDRAQAETDFRVNLKNEVGIETLVRELGAFQVETTKRLDGLEKRAARAERAARKFAGQEAGRGAARRVVSFRGLSMKRLSVLASVAVLGCGSSAHVDDADGGTGFGAPPGDAEGMRR